MKNLYYLFFLIFYSFLFPINAFSQKKNLYQPGYIVKQSGDTVKGYVEYLDWELSPDTIRFKNDLSDSPQKYTSAELKAFGLPEKDEYFDSKLVQIDFLKNGHILGDPLIFNSKKLNIFFKQVLIADSCSLFQMVDEENRMRLFIEKDQTFGELLHYSLMYYNKNGLKNNSNNDMYKSQLSFVNKVKNSNSLPYSTLKIANTIEKYNHSVKSYIYYKYRKPEKIILDFTGSFGYWLSSNIPNANIGSLGIGVRLSLPKKFNNRYINLSFIQANQFSTSNNFDNFSQISFSGGSYIGSRNIRPMIGMGLNMLIKAVSSVIFIDLGISYQRKINVFLRGEMETKSSDFHPAAKILSLNASFAFGNIKL